MKKQKCLVYGCGAFQRNNKSLIEEKYEIVDILDRYSENASIHDLSECTKDYSVVLIMIEKVEFIFEAIHYLSGSGISEKDIILGFSEYSCLGKNIDMHVSNDEGICITTEFKQKVVYDDKEFWEFYNSEVVAVLEKRGEQCERELSDIHRQMFEITFAGSKGVLSYNHDNDIFYRFIENGFFGWGLVATLNERAINCFDEPYVLDLGCADGFYYRRFLSHKKELKYIGCDLDKKSVCKAQRYLEMNEGNASFLCLDFVNNMPVPAQADCFTNVFWYASMHMFEDKTQKDILEDIKLRLGNRGILSGSVSIKNTGWKYCINAMKNEEELFVLLKKYFNHVWVCHDRDMANDAYFMASQKELPMMKYYC